MKTPETHAGVWFGSAGSFVDLQSVMPADYSNSQAYAVWTDGAVINVVGYATHATDTGSRLEAVLWTTTVPEPGALTFLTAALGLIDRRGRRLRQVA